MVVVVVEGVEVELEELVATLSVLVVVVVVGSLR